MEIDPKVSKEIKNSLDIIQLEESSFIIAVATHKDSELNISHKISTSKGIPIGGYIFDNQSECYILECTDYILLGQIPVAFKLEMRSANWKVRLPIPEALIKKHLNPIQKKDLMNFKNLFKQDEYEISFIQMVNPN
jgi:hypothetical protein